MGCILGRFRWTAIALLFTMMNAGAQKPAPIPMLDEALDAPGRAQVINEYARQLAELHVNPGKAKQAADDLRQRLARGEYDDQTSARTLAARVTADVAAIIPDRRTYLEYVPYDQTDVRQRPPVTPPPADNFGLAKFDTLAGNVGYLQITRLAAVDRASVEAAGRFMSQAADSSALIIDLRDAGGDGHQMAALLSSYLITDNRSYFFKDKQVHLHDQIDRSGSAVAEYWTSAEVAGKRFDSKKPIYVLVNERTSGAAEAFAYDLQQFKRAAIIGAPTLGDAYTQTSAAVSRHLRAVIATTRSTNVVSRRNWEGAGVQPDRMAAPADALNEALRMIVAASKPKTDTKETKPNQVR